MIPEDQSFILRMASQSTSSEVVNSSSSRRSLKRCASYMEDDETCNSTAPRIWRRKLSYDDDEEEAHVGTTPFLSVTSKEKYYLPYYYEDNTNEDYIDTSSIRFPTLLRARSCIDPEDEQAYEEHARQQEEECKEAEQRRAFVELFHEARDDFDTTMPSPQDNVIHENSDEDDDDDDLAPWLLIRQQRPCSTMDDSCSRQPNMISSKPNIVLGGDSKAQSLWLHDDDVSYQEREIY